MVWITSQVSDSHVLGKQFWFWLHVLSLWNSHLLHFDGKTSLTSFKFFEAFKFPDFNKITGQLKQQCLRPKKNFTGDSVCPEKVEFSKLLWHIQTWVFSHNLFYYTQACLLTQAGLQGWASTITNCYFIGDFFVMCKFY